MAGVEALRQMLPMATAARRATASAHHLTVGLQYGGSDGFSTLTANPALGRAVDRLVAAGGGDGFSWTPPKWTDIWGFPAETIALQDGRYLMIYGYRRPPYGARGVISQDGLTWDVKNEFVIREGGVPGNPAAEGPNASARRRRIN